MAGKKGRSGRKPGYVHNEETRQKIRTARLLEIAGKIAEGTERGDVKKLGPRVSMITALLRKTLPDLTATDITSKGESITIERVSFKRPVDEST